MRIYTRYKPLGKQRTWRGTLHLLVAAAGLALVGYVVYRNSITAPPSTTAGSPTNLARPFSAPATNQTARSLLARRPPPNTSNSLAGPAAFTPPLHLERPAENIIEAQIALARQGISSGSLDGANGPQTRAALRAFQGRCGLPATGQLDTATRHRLILDSPPLTSYVVTSDDLARLLPVSSTWLGKSEQPRLDYSTLLELVAEKHRAHPSLLRLLNPDVDWTRVAAGQTLAVPHVPPPVLPARLAFLRIRLQDRTLSGYGLRTNLLLHFPCSIAARIEKRPVGRLEVVAMAKDPTYTFNPRVFPESAEARRLGRKLDIAPGPNNPVGVAWIGLDRPGYGIHGTPRPEDVGRTESHGCFRLANWDAELLAQLVWRGLPVYVWP